MKSPSNEPIRPGSEVRCVCGSLVARLVGGAVELKCRRCKRVMLVPLENAPAGASTEQEADDEP